MTQLWARSTRSRLTDAVLKTFEEEILGPRHALCRGASREHRHSYLYPNGSRIILQGLDDPERQRSVAADVVWVNEPTEISEEAWEEVGGSLRETLGSTCPFRVKIGDHNPNTPGHWINKRAQPFPDELYPTVPEGEDGARMAEYFTPKMYLDTQRYNFARQEGKAHKVQTFHADNPHYWDFDKWGWKPSGHEYVTKQLGKMSGPRKARYLEGRPAAIEGVVFSEFSPKRHICKPFPNGIPADWPLYVAEDPGRDHPTAIVVVAVAPNGRKYVVDEYVKRETTVKQDAEWLRAAEESLWPARVRKKLGDPHYMFSKNKHNNGKTIAMQMKEYGHQFIPAPAATNCVELAAQVEMIRTTLITDLGDGKPELMFFDTCTIMTDAMQSWMYKRNSKGEVTGSEDQFQEKFKDETDAIRMIISSKPIHTARKATVVCSADE